MRGGEMLTAPKCRRGHRLNKGAVEAAKSRAEIGSPLPQTEVTVILVWIGALLVISGIVFMARQPLLRGRLSGGKRLGTGQASDTLEPQRAAGGFGVKSNWPGFALVALGALLLLVGASL